MMVTYPKTEKVPIKDVLHGVKLIDNYRWLEKNDKKVSEWTVAQEKVSREVLDKLPQRDWLTKKLDTLYRCDDKAIPWEILESKRIFFHTKKKDDEHWVYYTKEHEDAEPVELLNPNKWGKHDTLDIVKPSRDGKYLAFGKAQGGNENPIIKVMEVSTKKVLSDSLKGWKQRNVSWIKNNEGFYYSAKPLKGEVPEGEEYYWEAVYFHKLGTPAAEDKKIFSHPAMKEIYVDAQVTECGHYVIFTKRRLDDKQEIYFKKIANEEEPIPLTAGFDATYTVCVFDNNIFIRTDKDAPHGKIYMTPVNKPEKEHWEEFIPESEDTILAINGIAGNMYVTYLYNAHTRISIFSAKGEFIKDAHLPSIGTAGVYGYWSKPTVWVQFSSFIEPYSFYKYTMDKNKLVLYHKQPLEVDATKYKTEQVWYASKDGTNISMLVMGNKDMKKDGENPVLLTGYGGFNIPVIPHFYPIFLAWIDAGGIVAIPNLRGGGEYGDTWHKAGMKEKKQNVFDDFIAAAEWLIKEQYTNPKKLAIGGGSNGGLLVGAVSMQRPELFRAVLCSVPLLDMIRYHKFGLANTWTAEYGSADHAEDFKYIHAYSPYHHIVEGKQYPTMLIIGTENDARVHPLHARKMVAKLQETNPKGNPVLLLVYKHSGHGGGTNISTQIEQETDRFAFLMDAVGMKQ